MRTPYALSARFWALPLLALLAGAPSAVAATCTWQGGTGTWDTAASWSCGAVPTDADDVVIGSGTLTINDDVTIRDLTLTGGTIDGPGDLTVGRALVWETGTLSGAGTTTVVASTSLQEATSKNVGRRVVLRGVTTWSDGTLQMRDGGVLINAEGALFTDNAIGTHSIARVGTISTEPLVLNEGTWVIESAGTNTNVDFQNDGVLTIAGGGFDMNSPARFVNFSGGTVSGTSRLDFSSGAVVVMGGTTMPSGAVAGSFPVSGPFSMSEDHLLDVDLVGPGADEYDRLLVENGDVVIDGQLRVRIVSATVAGGTYPLLSVDENSTLTGCYAPEDIIVTQPDGHTESPYTVTVTCTSTGITATVTAPTAGEDGPHAAALQLTVSGANPFRAQTEVLVTAPTAGHVTVEAFDAMGRQVAVLYDDVVSAEQGVRVPFHAGSLAPGLYVVRATSAGTALGQTVTLAR